LLFWGPGTAPWPWTTLLGAINAIEISHIDRRNASGLRPLPCSWRWATAGILPSMCTHLLRTLFLKISGDHQRTGKWDGHVLSHATRMWLINHDQISGIYRFIGTRYISYAWLCSPVNGLKWVTWKIEKSNISVSRENLRSSIRVHAVGTRYESVLLSPYVVDCYPSSRFYVRCPGRVA